MPQVALLTHVTSAKRALRALLLAQLPPTLAQADALASDGVITPPPARAFLTNKGDLEQYPALSILATQGGQRENSVAQVMRWSVLVGWTLTGDDEERLTTQVERYSWAVRHILRDTLFNPPIDTGPIETGVESFTPQGQRPGALESPFVQGGFMEVFITTVE